MKLTDYISKHYPSKASYARAQGITRQQVNVWVNNGYIVLDGTIYGPIRPLKEVKMTEKEEKEFEQLIIERDYWQEKATELANDVGKLLEFDVGEHSNVNCPVTNAIDQVWNLEKNR